MRNTDIILNKQLDLVAEGILRVRENGEIQPLHTWATWKSLGYRVKKGEKAIATFPIWKYISKKQKTDIVEDPDSEDTKNKGRCYMKVAAFFTDTQVEKVGVVK